MAKYEVVFPIISGWQVFSVKAENKEQATELVLSGGPFDSVEYDDVEVGFDSNLAEVDLIEE